MAWDETDMISSFAGINAIMGQAGVKCRFIMTSVREDGEMFSDRFLVCDGTPEYIGRKVGKYYNHIYRKRYGEEGSEPTIEFVRIDIDADKY